MKFCYLILKKPVWKLEDGKKGTPLPEDMKAVSWCDGDLAQIENIVSQESLDLYKENMVCANKQNPARSGTEQAADLTNTFKLMNKL